MEAESPADEARMRRLESRKRYRDAHAQELKEKRKMANDTEEMRAKKRDEARAAIAKLLEAGVFEKLKPGRKRIYTPEEAAEAKKRQRQESYLRRKDRLNEAKIKLAQAENALEANVET